VPDGPPTYQAEVGAWSGSARFENTFKGFTGMGYVTGLDTVGSSVAVAVAVKSGGSHQLRFRVANSTGKQSTLTVRALDPKTGQAHGETLLHVPHTSAWATWQMVSISLAMAEGANLVVASVESAGQGGVNLDHVALA